MMSVAKKKMAVYYTVAIFFVALDRFLKVLSLNYFAGRETSIINGLLNFTFAKNYYIALSLPVAGPALLIAIPILIFGLIFYSIFFLKKGSIDLAGLLSVVSFCAMSNFYDRIRYGFVIDYLDLKWFTIFNVSDAMIVIALLIVLFGFYRPARFAR